MQRLCSNAFRVPNLVVNSLSWRVFAPRNGAELDAAARWSLVHTVARDGVAAAWTDEGLSKGLLMVFSLLPSDQSTEPCIPPSLVEQPDAAGSFASRKDSLESFLRSSVCSVFLSAWLNVIRVRLHAGGFVELTQGRFLDLRSLSSRCGVVYQLRVSIDAQGRLVLHASVFQARVSSYRPPDAAATSTCNASGLAPRSLVLLLPYSRPVVVLGVSSAASVAGRKLAQPLVLPSSHDEPVYDVRLLGSGPGANAVMRDVPASLLVCLREFAPDADASLRSLLFIDRSLPDDSVMDAIRGPDAGLPGRTGMWAFAASVAMFDVPAEGFDAFAASVVDARTPGSSWVTAAAGTPGTWQALASPSALRTPTAIRYPGRGGSSVQPDTPLQLQQLQQQQASVVPSFRAHGSATSSAQESVLPPLEPQFDLVPMQRLGDGEMRDGTQIGATMDEEDMLTDDSGASSSEESGGSDSEDGDKAEQQQQRASGAASSAADKDNSGAALHVSTAGVVRDSAAALDHTSSAFRAAETNSALTATSASVADITGATVGTLPGAPGTLASSLVPSQQPDTLAGLAPSSSLPGNATSAVPGSTAVGAASTGVLPAASAASPSATLRSGMKRSAAASPPGAAAAGDKRRRYDDDTFAVGDYNMDFSGEDILDEWLNEPPVPLVDLMTAAPEPGGAAAAAGAGDAAAAAAAAAAAVATATATATESLHNQGQHVLQHTARAEAATPDLSLIDTQMLVNDSAAGAASSASAAPSATDRASVGNADDTAQQLPPSQLLPRAAADSLPASSCYAPVPVDPLPRRVLTDQRFVYRVGHSATGAARASVLPALANVPIAPSVPYTAERQAPMDSDDSESSDAADDVDDVDEAAAVAGGGVGGGSGRSDGNASRTGSRVRRDVMAELDGNVRFAWQGYTKDTGDGTAGSKIEQSAERDEDNSDAGVPMTDTIDAAPCDSTRLLPQTPEQAAAAAAAAAGGADRQQSASSLPGTAQSHSADSSSSRAAAGPSASFSAAPAVLGSSADVAAAGSSGSGNGTRLGDGASAAASVMASYGAAGAQPTAAGAAARTPPSATMTMDSSTFDLTPALAQILLQQALCPFDNRPAGEHGMHELLQLDMAMRARQACGRLDPLREASEVSLQHASVRWLLDPLAEPVSPDLVWRRLLGLRRVLLDGFSDAKRPPLLLSVSGPLDLATALPEASVSRGIQSLPEPRLRAGYWREWIDLPPAALRNWDKLLLEPYAPPKSLNYYIVCPGGANLLHAIETFFANVSSVYEACQLGVHRCLRDATRVVAAPPDVAVGSCPPDAPWAPVVAQYTRACSELLQYITLHMATINASQQLVVYVVDPFLDLQPRLALLQGVKALTDPCNGLHIVVQPVPLRHILGHGHDQSAAMLRDLAFSVYTKCAERRPPQPLSWPMVQCMQPAYILAAPCDGISSPVLRQRSEEEIMLDPDQAGEEEVLPTTLHCSFMLIDGFAAVAWCDGQGELMQMRVLQAFSGSANAARTGSSGRGSNGSGKSDGPATGSSSNDGDDDNGNDNNNGSGGGGGGDCATGKPGSAERGSTNSSTDRIYTDKGGISSAGNGDGSAVSRSYTRHEVLMDLVRQIWNASVAIATTHASRAAIGGWDFVFQCFDRDLSISTAWEHVWKPVSDVRIRTAWLITLSWPKDVHWIDPRSQRGAFHAAACATASHLVLLGRVDSSISQQVLARARLFAESTSRTSDPCHCWPQTVDVTLVARMPSRDADNLSSEDVLLVIARQLHALSYLTVSARHPSRASCLPPHISGAQSLGQMLQALRS